MDSRLTRWTDPLIVASGCFSLLCYQDRESVKSGRRDLFTVSLSLYCFFPSFLEWKTVTMLCPTSGKHTWGKERRKTLAQGQKETEMISPPTSKRPNPANNQPLVSLAGDLRSGEFVLETTAPVNSSGQLQE